MDMWTRFSGDSRSIFLFMYPAFVSRLVPETVLPGGDRVWQLDRPMVPFYLNVGGKVSGETNPNCAAASMSVI